jgi:sigma-B regulation protein RsbU (phosphoserine phosphatase)
MRDQLLSRRDRVATAISLAGPDPGLAALLDEVDAALGRFESGAYGLCEVCHDPVEADRLIANPMERFCLDHLDVRERRALEEDLNLASQIQRALLPAHDLRLGGWHFDYGYQPAGAVSGDFVDILQTGNNDTYFALGDVSGKGIAAALLMSKLHAVFRSLISLGLEVDRLVERAGRLFSESSLPGQYATLIYGRAGKDGDVLVCNAGHPPALLVRGDGIERIPATGLPFGLFPDQKFALEKVTLGEGDVLLLYSDGVVEARNGSGEEYGMPRLCETAAKVRALPPRALVAGCLKEVAGFCNGASPTDDITIMGIRLS